MTGCAQLKASSHYRVFAYFCTFKISNELSYLHYISLFLDLSISGANDAPECPPSWIHLLFSPLPFSVYPSPLHPPLMSVSVLQTLMMGQSMYGCMQRVCVCARACKRYVEAEELTMSCPPTVQPSTQEGVIIKRRNSHVVHSARKSVCTGLLRRSTRLH